MAKKNTSPNCRLYLISPPQIDEPQEFAKTLGSAFKGGDVASFQLRLKDTTDEHICEVAESLMPICHDNDVAFILNDHAELAAKLGADGVHLGQSDGDIKEARSILGHDAVIGVTCHNSRHLAFDAGDKGADYVAFGAFYPTNTKEVSHVAEVDILTWWSDLAEIPCVAIGGITVENCAPLIEAGADFIAVSSAVWDNDAGAEAAVKQFNEKLASQETT